MRPPKDLYEAIVGKLYVGEAPEAVARHYRLDLNEVLAVAKEEAETLDGTPFLTKQGLPRKKPGRPPLADEVKEEILRRLRLNPNSYRVAKEMKTVSHMTVYKIAREAKIPLTHRYTDYPVEIPESPAPELASVRFTSAKVRQRFLAAIDAIGDPLIAHQGPIETGCLAARYHVAIDAGFVLGNEFTRLSTWGDSYDDCAVKLIEKIYREGALGKKILLVDGQATQGQYRSYTVEGANPAAMTFRRTRPALPTDKPKF